MKYQVYRPVAAMLGFLLTVTVPTRADIIKFSEIASSSSSSSSGSPTTNSTAVRLTYTTQNQEAPDNLQTIELGEVTGTICDCGEIAIPGEGFRFPKLPLLALGLVPLAFLFDRDGDTRYAPFTFATNVVLSPVNSISPTQPPPLLLLPPNNPIPEPATLLLFGSGLVAFGVAARRRRTQSKDALPNKA